MPGYFKYFKKYSLPAQSESCIEGNADKKNGSEKARYILIEKIQASPRVKEFLVNVKKAVIEASVKGVKTGLLTFFESLSESIKNGLK